jgi:hypothetical protein
VLPANARIFGFLPLADSARILVLPLYGVAPSGALARCCGFGGERSKRPLDGREIGRRTLGA